MHTMYTHMLIMCLLNVHVYLLDRILLVQVCYTVYMVDRTVLYYHLEIDIIPIVKYENL